MSTAAHAPNGEEDEMQQQAATAGQTNAATLAAPQRGGLIRRRDETVRNDDDEDDEEWAIIEHSDADIYGPEPPGDHKDSSSMNCYVKFGTKRVIKFDFTATTYQQPEKPELTGGDGGEK